MTTPQMPSPEHAQFDAICAPIEDFETLPTVAVQARTPEPLPGAEDEEDREESLDDMILAGLVAPY